MHLRALALAALLGGCGGETGILFAVDGAGLRPVKLEFHLAARDGCGRYVQSVDKTVVEVGGRDLTADPYRLMIAPGVAGTDAVVAVAVVAFDADGKAIGEAGLTALGFKPGKVVAVGRALQAVSPRQHWDDPDGACLCRDGLPWLATKADNACNGEVPGDPALTDKAECMQPLPAASAAGACDGVLVAGERAGRALPCFARLEASGGSECKVAVRGCLDEGAVGYAGTCAVDSASPTVPAPINAGQLGSLCDQWDACAQDACGDPVACLIKKGTANPTLQVVRGQVEDGLFKPCAMPRAVFTGVAALLTGNDVAPVVSGSAWLVELKSGRRGLVVSGDFLLQVDPFPWPAAGGDMGTLVLALGGPTHTIMVVNVKFDPTGCG